MQQDGELSRDRNNGLLLPACSSASYDHQSPATQVATRTEGAQDVMRRLHHERAQIRVSVFADSHLRIRFVRLMLLGLQPEVAANLPTVEKTIAIIQRNDECKSAEWPNAGDLL